MNMSPLYSYFALISGKYAILTLVLAVLMAGIMSSLANSGKVLSASHIFSNLILLISLLFALGFIVFIGYKIFLGDSYSFSSMFVSSFIVLLLTSASMILRSYAIGGYSFHISHLLLGIFVSLVTSIIFSGATKLAEKIKF